MASHQVRVTIVLGSAAPPLLVKLMQVFISGSKDASIIDQELTFDSENGIHILEALSESVDVGKYTFVFEIMLHDAELKKIYATGGRKKVPIFVTGVMQVDNAKIAVLDRDLGSVETQKKLIELKSALIFNMKIYISSRYDIQLTVGDAVMENSFMQALGHVELDFPEPPEKATRPPP
ncbi:hypothetical protein AgCh_004728 [Apium graveolens]